jgi:hypothetical protein
VRLGVREGLRGTDGIEGNWDRLAHGKVPGGEGLAFLL